MDTNHDNQAIIDQTYSYAANLLISQKKTTDEAKSALQEKGMDTDTASLIVDTLQTQIQQAKKEKANKDMLYGAMWCVGGTVATMANIGFIFWGAIIFGAIQFFRGLANA